MQKEQRTNSTSEIKAETSESWSAKDGNLGTDDGKPERDIG